MEKKYKCESCKHESNHHSIRTVGAIFAGTFKKVKSCRKCNWFLFDNKEEKKKILKLWKN